MVRLVIEKGPRGVELLCRVELTVRARRGRVTAQAAKEPVALRHAGRLLPLEPGVGAKGLAELFEAAERG